MNINDLEKILKKNLEKDINFLIINNIDPYNHYPIENYNNKNNDYNNIFDFLNNNTKRSNISESQWQSKIKTLEELKKQENIFLKLVDELTIKFKSKKINNKLNTICKVITFGIFDWNKYIDQKITTLKNLKYQENNFSKLADELTIKFKSKKINNKLNTICKVITFGIFDYNENISQKIRTLEIIKQIKWKNLENINFLKKGIEAEKEKMNQKDTIKEDINIENDLFLNKDETTCLSI